MDQKTNKSKLMIIILLLAIVVIVGIIGIVVVTSNKDKSIALNMENYTSYLNIEKTVLGDTTGGAFIDGNNINTGNFYKKASFWVKCNGTSSNFNYNNIVIQVEFTGTIRGYKGTKKDIKETVTFDKCDIAGNGEIFIPLKDNSDYYNYHSVTGKVISISGTVTPVK